MKYRSEGMGSHTLSGSGQVLGAGREREKPIFKDVSRGLAELLKWQKACLASAGP
jgi:hypothetical protein